MNKKQKFNISSIFKITILTVLLFFIAFYATAHAHGAEIKIGVLALRGAKETLKTWTPTAEYLNKQIPNYTFKIVPLDFDEISKTVALGKVDFVLENSAIYVKLENLYGIDRIATMKISWKGHEFNQFGSVIFTNKSNENISNFNDLKNKSLAAVHEASFGGWIMALREFDNKNIDPYKDFKSIEFSGTHDNVVYAVEKGLVDAGVIRTGILEKMDAEGKIEIENFKILNHQYSDDFYLLHSTSIYPEWPIARVKHTSDQLSQQVSIALLNMPTNSQAATTAGIAGWTIPRNYQLVHDCLKQLNINPYDVLTEITLMILFQKYWILVLAIFICILLLILAIVYGNKSRCKIEKINEIIREEVKEKTLELKTKNKELLIENKNRKEAEAKIKQLDKLKNKFIQTVSHQLRTPLTGIRWNLETLLKGRMGKLSKNQTELIRSTYEEGNNIINRLNDLLTIIDIGKGKILIEKNNISIQSLFKSVAGDYKIQSKPKDIDFTYTQPSKSIPKIKADGKKIREIFNQLLRNAIMYTKDGGKITTHISSTKNNVRFEVKDAGIGIPKAEQSEIFNQFYRATNASTMAPNQTGIGLAIAKHYIEQHNGKIGFKSTEGKGSTFWFEIPIKK